ncbi:expressed unknown protein [Seminavis robusta]|uniref:Uncharacterized protein n=1 Tax=Seminavis robusta TaxID=568900 RepID=A0A9N8EUU8_9STRA|nr:expressed unknown protein [Seminavis robusta]|eukprot:Sro1748_g295140.1 n/a (334) ;mRNA; f:13425-14426
MRLSRRKKVLVLGASRAAYVRQSNSIEQTVADIASRTSIGKTFQGGFESSFGRDLIRLCLTEIICNVDCFAMSLQYGVDFDPYYHVRGNFNKTKFLDTLLEQHKANCGETNGELEHIQRAPSLRFQQVIMDYNWLLSGWDRKSWRPQLFDTVLPAFVERDLLELEDTPDLPCGIFLPFSLHVCQQLVDAFEKLKDFFSISFMRKNEMKKLSLWRGTNAIPDKTYQHVFEKDPRQEDSYCTFVMGAVLGSEEVVPKEHLLEVLDCLEDFDQIRFVRLRPLKPDEIGTGGWTGLKEKDKVKNGIRPTRKTKKQPATNSNGSPTSSEKTKRRKTHR